MKINPYIECPIYDSNNFRLRIVEKGDSEGLLECYSDLESVKLFNSDNCSSDFIFTTKEEMDSCIDSWLSEYSEHNFVRLSIIDKLSNGPIGTIEFFVKKENFEGIGTVGLLRIDLAFKYETEKHIQEILDIIDDNLFDDFEVENIVTKAIPAAVERINTLKMSDYKFLNSKTVVSYDGYYIKQRKV